MRQPFRRLLLLVWSCACASGASTRLPAGHHGTEELMPGLDGRPAVSAPIGWESYGGDPGQSRASSMTDLDSLTVRQLAPAWIWWAGDSASRQRAGAPMARPGSFEASPLVIRDTMYVVTPLHRVAALDAATGRELWRFDPHSATRAINDDRGGFVQRGLATWTDGSQRRLFLATQGRLLAIDATSGRLVPAFGPGGTVSLVTGLAWPVDSDDVYNTSPPVVYGDLVIVGFSVPDRLSYGRDPPGALLAFSARDGRRVWTWSAMPAAGDTARRTWLDGSASRTGHMNIWSPFTLDVDRGLLFVPVSGPSNDYYGGDRPGDNLYSQSLVCLDAKTGRRRWHFQLTHHDVWDYDPAPPPVLVTSRRAGRDVAAVAQASKSGFVYVFERETGEPIWPIEERPVPSSDVPGEQLAVTQPFPTRPAPVARQGIDDSDLIDFTPDIRARALATLRRMRHGPLFSPASTQGTLLLPGWIGGAGWGATAYDPATRTLYVKSTDRPTFIRLVAPASGDPTVQGRWVRDTATGSPDALAALWVPAPGLLARLLGRGGFLPILRPPYGSLTAINMDDGEQRWHVVVGDSPDVRRHPALEGLRLPPLGVAGAPGPSVTASGLIFLTGGGSTLYALDRATGHTLWEHDLGGSGYANPVLYRVASGRPYVVIAVGGPPGAPARLMAFTIP
ncbi:MAG: PQQ-binding-like beta-propeller repeat protein [Gemmatimonadales bacterium]